MEWAEESNKLVCEYVLKGDVDAVQGVDLGGRYFEGAQKLVDEQIRRGGRRLARWVDLMAEKWYEEMKNAEAGLEVQEL